MDENPPTDTQAVAGRAMPETVKEPGLPEKVSQLRQKLGQAGTEVPVLCVVRPDLPDGCVGSGVGAGASSQGRARSGWRHDPADGDVRPRRSRILGRDSGIATREDLRAASGTTRLHSEGEWEAEAVGHTDGARPGSTDGDPVDPGADLRGRFPGLFVWVPAGATSAPGAGGDTWPLAGRVSSCVRRGSEELWRRPLSYSTGSEKHMTLRLTTRDEKGFLAGGANRVCY